MSNQRQAKIPLVNLYARTSQKSGNTYFTGTLGNLNVIMFENFNAQEGEPVFTVFLQEQNIQQNGQQQAPRQSYYRRNGTNGNSGGNTNE